jgi:ethanolamine-phosphate phospho-lyase
MRPIPVTASLICSIPHVWRVLGLQGVYEEMRSEGVLCIADEVQCGFGRTGDTFWAFEAHGIVPDMVSIGKSMGNGFPVAALVTSAELASQFANGMEYFNTYGGCTAAATAALAVLEAVGRERMQESAAEVGTLPRVSAAVLLNGCIAKY